MTVGCEIVGIYMIKYEEKGERVIRKQGSEVEMHLHDQ
jgi:hypothetical protein